MIFVVFPKKNHDNLTTFRDFYKTLQINSGNLVKLWIFD